MAQATLSDMMGEPDTDVEQTIDWIVDDSVSVAYDDWSDHLARLDESTALAFKADWGTIPESEQVAL